MSDATNVEMALQHNGAELNRSIQGHDEAGVGRLLPIMVATFRERYASPSDAPDQRLRAWGQCLERLIERSSQEAGGALVDELLGVAQTLVSRLTSTDDDRMFSARCHRRRAAARSDAGDLAHAIEDLCDALATYERLSPGPEGQLRQRLDLADVAEALGAVSVARGLTSEARVWFEREASERTAILEADLSDVFARSKVMVARHAAADCLPRDSDGREQEMVRSLLWPAPAICRL